jgi:hypothetical protein
MDLHVKTYGEDGEDSGLFEGYVKHLNDVQQEIVKRNPSGWADEFESRIHHIAAEAGRRHGTHVRISNDGQDTSFDKPDTDLPNSGQLTIHVYSTPAARHLGVVPGNYRSDSEEAASKLQRNQFWEQMNKNAEDRLMRGAKRMHEAGIHQDLSAGGDFTIDPDAEDPKDIYRPA